MVHSCLRNGRWPLICGVVVLASGCISPNLPSQRYHDPHDRGGLFGDYRGSGSESSQGCVRTIGHHGDDFEDDSSLGEHGSQKPPEVPWPRYHPVPTRPVFSAPVFSAPTSTLQGGLREAETTASSPFSER